MRIAYLAASPIPSSVASSVQVVKMCQGMARLGHDVVLLSPERREVRREVRDIHQFYGVEPTFEVRRIGWPSASGRLYHLSAGIMAAAARALRPDLVYGRFPEATALSADLGLPVVFETHLPVRPTGVAGVLFRRLLRHPRLQRVVVISRALAREYAQQFGVSDALLAVVPDAADDPGESPVAPLGPRDRLQVGYIGNVYVGKGVDMVFALARHCPWADFHVVGGEPDQLAAWASEAGALPNVRLHGYVPHGLTDRFRLGCDVLLAPYHHRVGTHGGGEASRWMSPLKLFEYMAAGRAIVISDLPVLREVVQDGVQALLCEPEQTEAWVEALRLLERDPALRQRLGRQARADFLRSHTWVARAQAALAGVRPAGRRLAARTVER